MPLTNSGRFTSVGLGYSPHTGNPDFIVSWNSPDGSGRITFKPSEGPPDDNADFNTLQTIYASDDGLLDSNGTALELSSDAIGGDDFALYFENIADLETEHALYNPLDAGSYTRYARARAISADLGRESTRTESDTGLVTIEHAVGFAPVPRTPDGDTQSATLADWQVIPINATRFRLKLTFGENEGVTASALNAQIPVLALLAHLESTRGTVGGEVGDDITADADVGGTRRYTWTYGSESIEFRIYDRLTSSVSGNIVTVALKCQLQGASTSYTALDLAEYVRGETATIAAQTDGEAPDFGAVDVPIAAQRIDFADGVSLLHRDKVLILRDEASELPLDNAHGRAIDITDLEQVSGKYIANAKADVIHLPSGGGSQTLKIPEPPDIVLAPGTYFEQAYHNLDAGTLLRIDDWNDTRLLDLEAGQRAVFHIGLNNDGTGEALLVSDLPRRAIHAHTVSGTPDHLGTAEWFQNGSYQEHIIPATRRTYMDLDSFETNGPSSNNMPDNFYVPYAVKILKPGLLDIRLNFTMRIKSGASGAFYDGWRTRIWKQSDGQTIPTNSAPETYGGASYSYAGFSGSLSQRSINLTQTMPVKADDVISFTVRRYGSVTAQNVEMVSIDRELILSPRIISEYMPAS